MMRNYRITGGTGVSPVLRRQNAQRKQAPGLAVTACVGRLLALRVLAMRLLALRVLAP